METDNILKSASFSQEFSPKVFYSSHDLKIPFIYLEKGQEIAPHKGGTAVFYFLDGEGVLTAGDKKIKIKKGSLAVAGKGDERGIKCEKKINAFGAHIRLKDIILSLPLKNIKDVFFNCLCPVFCLYLESLFI